MVGVLRERGGVGKLGGRLGPVMGGYVAVVGQEELGHSSGRQLGSDNYLNYMFINIWVNMKYI